MNNADIIQAYHTAIWDKKNISAIDDYFAPTATIHSVFESTQGTDNMKTLIKQWHQAFPDLHVTWDDTICEGNKVVSRWHAQGTQQGDFLGHSASGKQVRYTGISIYELENGKVTGYWCVIDMKHLLDQLA